jgi:hypothetical protein
LHINHDSATRRCCRDLEIVGSNTAQTTFVGKLSFTCASASTNTQNTHIPATGQNKILALHMSAVIGHFLTCTLQNHYNSLHSCFTMKITLKGNQLLLKINSQLPHDSEQRATRTFTPYSYHLFLPIN